MTARPEEQIDLMEVAGRLMELVDARKTFHGYGKARLLANLAHEVLDQ